MSQAPNKLLKRKWQDDDTLRHYTRLHNIKPVTVNTTAPNDYVFLKTKPKVRQLKEGKSMAVLTLGRSWDTNRKRQPQSLLQNA